MADTETTESAVPETTATAEETTTTEAPASNEPSIDDLLKEIKELRNENGNRRVKAKRYDEVFSQYENEEQVEGWLELADTFAKDPQSAAAAMKELADTILAEQKAEGVTQAEGLSRNEVEKMIKAQAQEIQLAQDVARLEAEARSLGYTPESEDLDTRLDYEDLCRVALTLPGGDLKEAHKIMEARKQKYVDAYVTGKSKSAENTPTAPAAGGNAVSQEQEFAVKNVADLEKKVLAKYFPGRKQI